ncbi:hypothetical protein D3C79_707160 [compost metagenome]
MAIEDHPGGDRLAAGVLVIAVHGVDKFQVRRSLIDKAPAQAVDHDGTRERPLGKYPTGFFFAGHANSRCPPGPIHQGGRRAQLDTGL